jgi:hypothetical protein
LAIKQLDVVLQIQRLIKVWIKPQEIAKLTIVQREIKMSHLNANSGWFELRFDIFYPSFSLCLKPYKYMNVSRRKGMIKHAGSVERTMAIHCSVYNGFYFTLFSSSLTILSVHRFSGLQ